VNVLDVVRALRFVVGVEQATAEELRRGNVAPATLFAATPERATPTLEGAPTVEVTDVVLLLRAAVGLTVFTDPL
jgi:hypothetical protein